MMKKILLLSISIFCFTQVFAEGIKFLHSFEEALELAKQENKLIFVDAYTTWCGPCKRMSRDVFPQADVGEFFNTSFINVKLDMEKGEGQDFQRKYRVNAFPTLLFLDIDGSLIHRKVGAINGSGLIQIGKQAVEKGDPTIKMIEAYESGNRDAPFIVSLLKALDQNNKPRALIANEFLRDSTVSEDMLIQILYFGAERADSRLFDDLIAKRSAMNTAFSVSDVNHKILSACRNTVKAAIEFETEDLLWFAEEKINTLLPLESDAFEIQSRAYFYAEFADKDAFIKVLNSAKKERFNEREVVSFISLQYWDDQEILEKCIKLLNKDIQGPAAAKAYFLQGQLHFKTGNTTEAMNAIDEAQLRVGENQKLSERIKKFKAHINRS